MSQTKPIEKSYLAWPPVIEPEEVFQQTVGFSYLSTDEAGQLFWVENRPEESGRSVIVFRNLSGVVKDVIPKPYSARSRVFEYGGVPYVASKGQVYFVNLSDQRIYKIDLNLPLVEPVPITTEKTKGLETGKYADLTLSPDGRWLLFAYEKEFPKKEAVNEIGILDLQAPAPQEAQSLVSGADFFKAPKFSPDGKNVAWLEWNHPYMPWDSTLLF